MYSLYCCKPSKSKSQVLVSKMQYYLCNGRQALLVDKSAQFKFHRKFLELSHHNLKEDLLILREILHILFEVLLNPCTAHQQADGVFSSLDAHSKLKARIGRGTSQKQSRLPWTRRKARASVCWYHRNLRPSLPQRPPSAPSVYGINLQSQAAAVQLDGRLVAKCSAANKTPHRLWESAC